MLVMKTHPRSDGREQALMTFGAVTVPRGEVFVTTKFYPGRKFSQRRPDPVAEADQAQERKWW